jgi:hypothetical protein
MKFSLELDRSRLQGIDESATDKKLIADWLRMAYCQQAAAVDPFYKLCWYKLLRQIEQSKDPAVELSEEQSAMVLCALLRVNSGPESTEMLCQLLGRFGMAQ